MNIRALALMLLIWLTGCKAPQRVVEVPVKTIEREVTRLIPYRLPGDSVLMQAVFECDSANNVLMTSLEETKSKLTTAFKFRGGVLDYRVMKPPDTVWLKSDSIIINREIPVIVEVSKVEYRQSRFQRIFFYLGLIMSAGGLTWLAGLITKR